MAEIVAGRFPVRRRYGQVKWGPHEAARGPGGHRLIESNGPPAPAFEESPFARDASGASSASVPRSSARRTITCSNLDGMGIG